MKLSLSEQQQIYIYIYLILWCHLLNVLVKCVKTYAHLLVDQKLHMCKTFCNLTLINMATVQKVQALLGTLKRGPIEDMYLKEPK